MLKNKNLKFFLLTLFCTFYLLTGCSENDSKNSTAADTHNNELQTSDDDNDDMSPEEDVLIVGTSADHLPFEFVKDSQIVGFDIDLINAIAKKLKMKVMIKDMQFYLIIPSLQNGDINIAISGISETPERSQVIDFSVPYYYNNFAILSIDTLDPSNPIQPGMKIGVQTGSLMNQWITKQDVKVDVMSMDNALVLVEELKNKNLDGVLFDQITAKDIAKSNPEIPMKVTELQGLKTKGIAIGVQKDDPILDRINSAINELQESGELDKIKHAWGL